MQFYVRLYNLLNMHLLQRDMEHQHILEMQEQQREQKNKMVETRRNDSDPSKPKRYHVMGYGNRFELELEEKHVTSMPSAASKPQKISISENDAILDDSADHSKFESVQIHSPKHNRRPGSEARARNQAKVHKTASKEDEVEEDIHAELASSVSQTAMKIPHHAAWMRGDGADENGRDVRPLRSDKSKPAEKNRDNDRPGSDKKKPRVVRGPVSTIGPRSNRKIIKNALVYVCLAGGPMKHDLDSVLVRVFCSCVCLVFAELTILHQEELNFCKGVHFIILLKKRRMFIFQGLYLLDTNSKQVLFSFLCFSGRY
jgi:hypothetical protein